MLLDYQVSFIQNVKAIVENNWLRKKPPLRVLDMGCETSGRQLSEIAKLNSGEVVGVNVAAGFPDSNAIQVAGGQVRLLNMSGLDLKFPDESFDLVVSANVLEHVPCPNIFIKEAARVLKPSGICWMETAPVWTSARGHHVMKSMVDQSCPWERGFSDDG